MKGTPDNFELLEPPSPDALIPDSPVETWMIVVAALVVLAIIALVVFRKKKAAVVDPLAIRITAYNEAKNALRNLHASGTRDAAVQCSLIVRKYLSTAAADPALFETHEETLARHGVLAGFTETARSAASAGFSRLAALKYAADVPDVATEEVIGKSTELLETLHGGFSA